MYDETLIPDVPERDSSRPYAATIFNTVVNDDDDLYVTILGIDDATSKHGPCRWTPRPGNPDPVMPTEGDEALVSFDNEGKLWIIGWWPYG